MDESAARYYTGDWLADYRAPPAPSTPAGEMLRAAADIAEGQRAHGRAERSFEAIARLWTVYLRARKEGVEEPVSAMDVAHMMALLKMGRAIQGVPTWDTSLDMAGYCALAGEVAGVVP